MSSVFKQRKKLGKNISEGEFFLRNLTFRQDPFPKTTLYIVIFSFVGLILSSGYLMVKMFI